MKNYILTILTIFLAIECTNAQQLIGQEKLKSDIDYFVKEAYEIHPNLYENIDSTTFSKAIDSLKAIISSSMTDWDFFRIIAPLSAQIADGHTGIYPNDEFFEIKKKPFPLQVFVKENKLYVIKNFSNVEEIKPGLEIKAINNLQSSKIINTLKSFLPSETDLRKETIVNKMFPMLYYMVFGSFDEYKIEIHKDGKNTTHSVNTVRNTNNNIPHEEKSSFTVLKNQIGLLDLRNFDNEGFIEFIDSIFTKISEDKIENLIVDLRNNGGGNENMADTLLCYLTDKSYKQFDSKMFKISKVTKRLYNEYKREQIGHANNYFYNVPQPIKIPPRKKNRFHGNLYVLSSSYTYSTAASFTAAIKCYQLGLIIGQETGQTEVCYGNLYGFKLPNSGLPCSVSKDFYTLACGKSKTHGIQPDYLIIPDITDKIEQIDKDLKFTLDLIERKNN